MTGTGDDAGAYARAIESAFIRLRGAPLLLSPEDWRTVEGWRRAGVPLDLVLRTLEAVFARRIERGAKGRVNSLRYVAPAVEEAWEELAELRAGGHRGEATPVDVEDRLRRLAEALPAALPGRDELVAAVLAAGERPADAERRLAELEAEFLADLAEGLEPDRRQEIESQIESQLGRWRVRLGAERADELEPQIRRRILRREFELPVLSLFSLPDDR